MQKNRVSTKFRREAIPSKSYINNKIRTFHNITGSCQGQVLFSQWQGTGPARTWHCPATAFAPHSTETTRPVVHHSIYFNTADYRQTDTQLVALLHLRNQQRHIEHTTIVRNMNNVCHLHTMQKIISRFWRCH